MNYDYQPYRISCLAANYAISFALMVIWTSAIRNVSMVERKLRQMRPERGWINGESRIHILIHPTPTRQHF